MNRLPANLPANPSESTKRRNPHIYGDEVPKVIQELSDKGFPPFTKIVAPRIRQSSKPLLNKLESDLFNHLQTQTISTIIKQGLTFRLGNGVRYSPDLFCFSYEWRGEVRPTAFECKGDWFPDDARVKLKMFATLYPQILVLLASKNDGQWLFQEVYP